MDVTLRKKFLDKFTPNEQLVMLRLLLNADEQGMVEFSDRGISKTTGIPYQKVRTIHKHFLEKKTITNIESNASDNAVGNAHQKFVTICNIDTYKTFGSDGNAVGNALTNAKTKQQKSTNDKKVIKEKVRKEKDEKFEECWLAYNRKGSKAKSFEYWQKLSDKEKVRVLPHIKAYIGSREKQFQKDFERYLRDKVFNDVIIKGNEVVYNPEKFYNTDDYMPKCDDVFQRWNPVRKCLEVNSPYFNMWDDGYNDKERPDGATVAYQQYTWKWNRQTKEWVKQND